VHAEGRPAPAKYVPGAQSAQLVSPAVAANCPAPQKAQLAAAGALDARPAAQGAHALAPPAEKVPAAQGKVAKELWPVAAQ
jgi:hypothetical protein